MTIERLNMRGGSWRAPREGGQPERIQAPRWPRGNHQSSLTLQKVPDKAAIKPRLRIFSNCPQIYFTVLSIADRIRVKIRKRIKVCMGMERTIADSSARQILQR
jgi:hypothetical protein